MAKRGAGRSELVIASGSTPRVRKVRKYEWTKKKEELFLTRLAETCNVTLAVEAVGMSLTGAYERRKKVASFRAAWAEAIATAYQRLELMMLERALNGTEKVVQRRDGSEERMREYSDRTALALLKMHRESAAQADEEPAEADVEEVRARLVDKLERLRGRFAAQGASQ